MRRMYDVVGLGENSIDYVYRLPVFPRPSGPLSKVQIAAAQVLPGGQVATTVATCASLGLQTDRKSTRLNSSHFVPDRKSVV